MRFLLIALLAVVALPAAADAATLVGGPAGSPLHLLRSDLSARRGAPRCRGTPSPPCCRRTAAGSPR